MQPWRTAIASSDETHIWIRGYDIASLMRRASFADLLFLHGNGDRPCHQHDDQQDEQLQHEQLGAQGQGSEHPAIFACC